ncbi:alpha/beta hydrolase [Conexibacter woesei]|uniref:alpha/beta hydrolase n=1 Tax=Conexibacter woesei TaxID=191495 RepID=UPI000412AED7|nr:alpha/beta hydrolase [Conexibacter woesei]
MRVGAVGIALLCAVAVAGCGGGGAPEPTRTARTSAPRVVAAAPAARLRSATCGPRVGGGFRCATLTVPLHRRGPRAADGRTLTLRVALQDGASHPRGDYIMLTGGPGQPGLPFAARLAARLRSVTSGMRLVVVDQRGTGDGALSCPALQRTAGTSDLAVPPRAAVTACGRRLASARAAYTTADTVADLDALRRALRDPEWVVGGISYGTFVAERYALAHPRQTRALILDSVVPQEGAELLERVPLRATARVLGPAATADLRRVLRDHPDLGPGLFDAITERSIGVPHLGAVTRALRAGAAGNLRPIRTLLLLTRGEERGVPARFFSSGLHAATLCADAPAAWPGGPAAPLRVREAALAALRRRVPASATAPWPVSTAFGQGLLATCRAWPPTTAPPAPSRAARITTPALLLAGDRDLSTPLEWARAQARAMGDARLVTVHGAGHSILSREPGSTGRDALRSFLARRLG